MELHPQTGILLADDSEPSGHLADAGLEDHPRTVVSQQVAKALDGLYPNIMANRPYRDHYRRYLLPAFPLSGEDSGGSVPSLWHDTWLAVAFTLSMSELLKRLCRAIEDKVFGVGVFLRRRL